MHTVDIHVRFYELDPYRHVNHSAYIQYFETARIQLLEDIDLGLIIWKTAAIASW
ncbi:MAG: hypothetical protein KJO36_14155 [Acidimicrobiia bacterium]|nr:hypothetical protein [Acidimicrobiia bacterium]